MIVAVDRRLVEEIAPGFLIVLLWREVVLQNRVLKGGLHAT